MKLFSTFTTRPDYTGNPARSSGRTLVNAECVIADFEELPPGKVRALEVAEAITVHCQDDGQRWTTTVVCVGNL